MSEQKVSRKQLVAACEALGLDGTEVRAVTLERDRVVVQRYELNEFGGRIKSSRGPRYLVEVVTVDVVDGEVTA